MSQRPFQDWLWDGPGHIAVQFNSRGCEISAFSTNSEKENWARKVGAHNFLNSHNRVALRFTKYSLDLVLVTVNAYLYWNAYLNMPMPRRKLHIVGQTPLWSRYISSNYKLALDRGSPTGSPVPIWMMLAFCNRHKIRSHVKEFPFLGLTRQWII